MINFFNISLTMINLLAPCICFDRKKEKKCLKKLTLYSFPLQQYLINIETDDT